MVVVVDVGADLALNGSSEPDPATAFFESADELHRSPVPAVVIEVPTELIVAASLSGALLLDPDGGPVVGRNFEDFTIDVPSGVLDLFASGRVTGYETTRTLRRTGHDELAVSVWLHRFDHQARSRFALAVFSVPELIPALADTLPDSGEPTVVGTTDQLLVIERVSNDASALFGRASAALLGHPLTDVVDQDARSQLVAAIDAAAATNRAVTLNVGVQIADAARPAPGLVCQVVILPMEPAPSCAFVFLRLPNTTSAVPTYAPDLAGLLVRLHRGAEVAGLARRLSDITDRDVPGLGELSTREWEIVARLLDGDRVPAIAAELFLSPSTVRSHLSLAFDKLNVGSQQELIDLLRHGRAS